MTASRSPATSPDKHALGEIDDDGHQDRYHRRYRFVCRCGAAGSWRESRTLARGDHAAHRAAAEAK